MLDYLSWLFADFPNYIDFLIGASLAGVLFACVVADEIATRIMGDN